MAEKNFIFSFLKRVRLVQKLESNRLAILEVTESILQMKLEQTNYQKTMLSSHVNLMTLSTMKKMGFILNIGNAPFVVNSFLTVKVA
ncbi:hypothetical protein [Fibrobacter sp. HC4]|uniref:hypothetical protein n=1 Tax=Fibrobacter sp. HC4 TaxID=3239812 RepID=UPI000C71159F|nr:hypothetical protein [Fibrobacter succinogenes]MCQ2101140.1 hypothetical protein [Fibrobacter sp.]